FNKALHQMPRKIAGNLIARITANRAFSHSLGPQAKMTMAPGTSAAEARPDVVATRPNRRE
ncbi:hypothetical protein, partial [Bradyrhizobium sp. Rc2d]|uniref:hypothetical protein n=1 Tax=Bradyrhizobium sp. Rc2d TaxID=1855321 RepID=UPI001AECACFA